MDFKYNMSVAELKKRTSKKYYRKLEFLKPTSREVKKLTSDELRVLCHLTRAAYLIEKVQFQLENVKNLQILEFLDKEIANNLIFGVVKFPEWWYFIKTL